MLVMKFGGSSVGSAKALSALRSIVRERMEREARLLIVVSALQGVTDSLLGLSTMAAEGGDSWKGSFQGLHTRHSLVIAELQLDSEQLRSRVDTLLNEAQQVLQGIALLGEASPRSRDLIASFGERLSAEIVTELLRPIAPSVTPLDARSVIRTNDSFGKAVVDTTMSYKGIRTFVEATTSRCVVATGFIGATEKGITTTLGRGGSDYSAALFGAALQAREIEIWTDVDGVLTADPRKVKTAFSIPSLSYEEAMELSHFGAKVIYPPTIQPALDANIPVRILNTFNPCHPGTRIGNSAAGEKHLITGISSLPKVSLLRIEGSGMVGVAGVSSRLFGALARRGISVILISQASSEHSICFALAPEDGPVAVCALGEEFALEIAAHLIQPPIIEEDSAIVAVIGEAMRATPGVAGRLFQALGRNNINVRAIAQGSSELNISAVIPSRDEAKAIAALHDAFFLSDVTTLHLFLIGTGSIAQALLQQIASQTKRLRQEYRLELRINGLMNRRKMLVCPEPIPVESAAQRLQEGDSADLHRFLQQLRAQNLPNTILVDCSASAEPPRFYAELLRNNISIVTPNKIGNSGDMAQCRAIREALRSGSARFLYETNVGAALPVLSTLADLLISGDRVHRIDAALSGTLGFLCHGLMENQPFSALVRRAHERGLTEPDPRDDLSGLDVARKLLILGREMGLDLELRDITVQPMLREEHASPSPEAFLASLESYDTHFRELAESTRSAGKALRFVGSVEERGRAEVSLQAVPTASPFFHLSGTDNMIAFTTARYHESPLVVRGPGAGREVTAAGVFADIIRAGSASR